MPSQWILLIDIDRESTRTIGLIGEERGYEVIVATKASKNRIKGEIRDLETIVFQVDQPDFKEQDEEAHSIKSGSFEGLVFLGVTRPRFSGLFAHLDEGVNVWMRHVIDGPVTESEVLTLLN